MLYFSVVNRSTSRISADVKTFRISYLTCHTYLEIESGLPSDEVLSGKAICTDILEVCYTGFRKYLL